MSGGTLVALAADEIVMDRDAVLGPVDPQLGNLPRGFWPAVSILAALETPNDNRDDQTLILGDMARKSIDQVHDTVYELLLEAHGAADAERLAALLSHGRWTDDFPIRFGYAAEIGLPVNNEPPMPSTSSWRSTRSAASGDPRRVRARALPRGRLLRLPGPVPHSAQ